LVIVPAFQVPQPRTPPRAVARESKTMTRLVAIASIMTVIGIATPACAYTQEEQMACQNDAFKFCDRMIPDENRVKSCLIANMRKLTPACRKLFRRGRR
jgi:hypothetical protein